MKQISTGAGLVFGAACIIGAVAFASPKPAAPVAAARDERSSAASFLSPAPCEDFEPQIWFTTVHSIAACPDGSMRFPVGLGSPGIDLDGNGVLEFIVTAPAIDLTTSDQPVLLNQHVDVIAGETTFRHRPVMLSGPMRQYVLSHVPDATSCILYTPSWRDMDNDGDLDAVTGFYVMQPSSMYSGTVWIENTGLPAAPPANPYDLDRDGSVNTADLSLLLLEFTD